MIQNYISTFLLFGGIIISIIGWILSFNMIIIGYIMVMLFPLFLNDEYEIEKWKEEYLK